MIYFDHISPRNENCKSTCQISDIACRTCNLYPFSACTSTCKLSQAPVFLMPTALTSHMFADFLSLLTTSMNITPSSVVPVAVVIVLSGTLWTLSRKPLSYAYFPPILDERGHSIPYADEDTRFSRFSHGKEVGDRFVQQMGPIYTFRAGSTRELYVSFLQPFESN
jgi:hypothetical protein